MCEGPRNRVYFGRQVTAGLQNKLHAVDAKRQLSYYHFIAGDHRSDILCVFVFFLNMFNLKVEVFLFDGCTKFVSVNNGDDVIYKLSRCRF